MRTGHPERLVAIVAMLAVTAALLVLFVGLAGDAPLVPGSQGRPASADDGALERARVTRVVDGDTVVITIDGREERLRYVGVDAPEMGDPDAGSPAECGGVEAAEANRALVLDRVLELERDVSDRDRFGRLLRHPWITVDGERTLVTELLARDGAVEARRYPPDVRHDARLAAAERRARAEAAGIWGRC